MVSAGGVAVGLVAGALTGWFLVPAAADALLRRSHARTVSWWWDSYGTYLAFKREHPACEPSASAAGEEGALALWRGDALAMAEAGTLARERVQALADAGLAVEEANAVRDEATQQERCTFVAKPWQCGLCALACAVWLATLVLAGVPVVPAVALAICGVVMATVVVCDLRARIIPLEACVLVALAGVVAQLTMGGISALVAGALFAALVGAGCLLANRLACGRTLPVGRGDVRCMAALSLASGPAAPVGLFACYVCAAACSLAGLVAGKLTLKSGFPMAPFLAVWLVAVLVVAPLG